MYGIVTKLIVFKSPVSIHLDIKNKSYSRITEIKYIKLDTGSVKTLKIWSCESRALLLLAGWHNACFKSVYILCGPSAKVNTVYLVNETN